MANLTAEVISIGDEMTSGARLDTNGQWLSRRLGELGINVEFHTTVGDSLSNNVDVFRSAVDRTDIVIATGGLGPTRDDLTREVLALVSGQPLELRPDVLAQIEAMFTRRGRVMAQRNEVQAMFPVSSLIIPNPHGTAPGIDVSVERDGGGTCRVMALPGVPAEMKQMFEETVAPRLMEQAGGASHIRHHVMKFFGTGESDMELRLGEMIARDRVPRVGITVSEATLSLRITAMGESEAQCVALIEPTRKEIIERVGDLFFGEGEHFEQYHAINATLQERNESLLIVELGYAALLGDWFASLGDAPAYLGSVSFANVDQLVRFTTSDGLASALSKLKSQANASWLLLVDSYPAVPKGDDTALPPTAFRVVVLGASNSNTSIDHQIAGHPDILHARVAKMAMAFFRKQLDLAKHE